MKLQLKNLNIITSKKNLASLPPGKLLINTINAHSYNTALKDPLFAEALMNGDALIPDGASIVMACRWLKAKSQPEERIAGWDLFQLEMNRIEDESKARRNINKEDLPLKVMFMGSSEKVLSLIREKSSYDYPNLEIVTYSPPYKNKFSDKDNNDIIEIINKANPDLLWIGMTAPKQEKWVYSHWSELDINCHCGTVGAVFDFYAGTSKRAPIWWQTHGLEWMYRLLKEPKRMWRRYLVGNVLFLYNIAKEKL